MNVEKGIFHLGKWHHFSSQTQDTGIDSLDEWQEHLVCSTECYVKKLTCLVDRLKIFESAIIDNMTIEFASLLIDELKP